MQSLQARGHTCSCRELIYLIGPDYRRDTGRSPRGWHRVRLVIVEQEAEW
ncbi:MAG: hypothetical protein L0L69_07125 [Propionibacterium sp.]|nr:hypothetical protein [Propionibacterium sp.]